MPEISRFLGIVISRDPGSRNGKGNPEIRTVFVRATFSIASLNVNDMHIAEPDWKTFKKVSEKALDGFFRRVAGERGNIRSVSVGLRK